MSRHVNGADNRLTGGPSADAETAASPVGDAAPGGTESHEDAEAAHVESILERIKALPPSVGMALVVAGIVILPLPGPFGTPLILAGGLALAPRTFGGVGNVGKTMFPKMRRHAMRVLERYLDDMERRYPSRG